jgi:hypothetical protein
MGEFQLFLRTTQNMILNFISFSILMLMSRLHLEFTMLIQTMLIPNKRTLEKK